MIIKECYVSHNGISCLTDVNSLINIKEINVNKLGINTYWKNNLLFYISMRIAEFVAKDFINNINFISNKDNSNELIDFIIFT